MSYLSNKKRRPLSGHLHSPKRALCRLSNAACLVVQAPHVRCPATPPAASSGDLRQAKARLCTALHCYELASLLLHEAKTAYSDAWARWDLSNEPDKSAALNLPPAGAGDRP